jgi:hypothetical protein
MADYIVLKSFITEFKENIEWIASFKRNVTTEWRPRLEESYRDMRICIRRGEILINKEVDDKDLIEDITNFCKLTQKKFEVLKKDYILMFYTEE